MKTMVVMFASFLTLAIPLSAQEIVKNPDKPANPKSGRILSLRQELRITDEGGEFFLRYPGILKTGGRLLAVQGDALFIAEKTPEEIIEIARYRIVE